MQALDSNGQPVNQSDTKAVVTWINSNAGKAGFFIPSIYISSVPAVTRNGQPIPPAAEVELKAYAAWADQHWPATQALEEYLHGTAPKPSFVVDSEGQLPTTVTNDMPTAQIAEVNPT